MIPSDTELVRTIGYSQIGLGVADYIADSAVTTDSSSTFQAADGRWFRLVVNGLVPVEQLGALGDGTTSDTQAITDALAFNSILLSAGRT